MYALNCLALPRGPYLAPFDIEDDRTARPLGWPDGEFVLVIALLVVAECLHLAREEASEHDGFCGVECEVEDLRPDRDFRHVLVVASQ